jgi:hypothetical protein
VEEAGEKLEEDNAVANGRDEGESKDEGLENLEDQS